MKKYNIAVVGATGVVGEMFLKVLAESSMPIDNLYLFASNKSKGKVIKWKEQEVVVEELTESSFNRNIDYALFSAGGEISKKYAPLASKNNIQVVDNSSYWRMVDGIPLVVPEINLHAVTSKGVIVANPNCSTIQSVLPLKVLSDNYGLKRVAYTTYQAVSGAGTKGISDLENTLANKPKSYFPYDISKSCIPQIDVFLDNGYTKEEMKMINETRKILELPNLPVTATCVRVPIFNGHCVAINIELEKEFTIEKVKEQLANYPSIILMDDVSKGVYPVSELANGRNEVLVGRLRIDDSNKNTLHLWTVADNIRKGAAANAVQIVEQLIKRGDYNEN